MKYGRYLEEGGGEGDGGGGGGQAEGGGGNAVDFRSIALTGEGVPDKLQGKTGADLLKAFESANTTLGKHATTISELKTKLAEATPADNGVDLKGLFPKLIQASRESDRVDAQLAEQISEATGLNQETLNHFASLMHNDWNTKMGGLQTKLHQLMDRNDIDLIASLDAAQSGDVFTDAELSGILASVNMGGVDTLKIMVERLAANGVDVTGQTLGRKGTKNPLNLPDPIKGRSGGGAGGGTAPYASREEARAALNEAIADRSGEKRKVYDARMKVSNTRSWGGPLQG